MTITINHAFVNPKADGGDNTITRPSDWNAGLVTSMASGVILGRATVGVGVFEELPVAVDASGNITASGNISVPSVNYYAINGVRYFWAISTSIYIGSSVGNTLDTGGTNLGFGSNIMTGVTSGSSNVGLGANALAAMVSGSANLAIGVNALSTVIGGNSNTAIGVVALNAATGSNNTAIGGSTLQDVTGGQNNTAKGTNTGRGIQSGNNNTIIGAGVTGLSSGLTGAIILADGVGGIKADYNNTLASYWTFAAGINSNSPTGGIGYSTGAGGAITQTGSRTTGVTLNKVSGAITLVSAAGSATAATFTVSNSTVVATDVIYVCQKSGADKYRIDVTNVGASTFDITFNTTGGTTTEQPVFNFVVIKGVAA